MSSSQLEKTYLNSTARTSTFWNEVSRLFSFTSNTEIKYCTVYTDSNTVYKYFCYKNEVCCKTGNGCCPHNASNKYLESWAFWTCIFFRICIFFVIITIYLICWYCKKLEKSRHARALHLAQQGRNRNVIVAQQSRNNSNCCSNSVSSEQSRDSSRRPNRNNVDRLLENLIRDYRTRLGTDEPPLDNLPVYPTAPPRTKNTHREPPPKYVDALNMPRPHQKPQRITSSRSENGQSGASHSARSTDDGPVDRRNFVIIEFNGDQRVPTYEEATRAHFV